MQLDPMINGYLHLLQTTKLLSGEALYQFRILSEIFDVLVTFLFLRHNSRHPQFKVGEFYFGS